MRWSSVDAENGRWGRGGGQQPEIDINNHEWVDALGMLLRVAGDCTLRMASPAQYGPTTESGPPAVQLRPCEENASPWRRCCFLLVTFKIQNMHSHTVEILEVWSMGAAQDDRHRTSEKANFHRATRCQKVRKGESEKKTGFARESSPQAK